MKRILFAVTVILTAVLSSVSVQASDLLAELDGANHAFAKAILEKDVEHLVGDYTSDACVLAPSSPRTCGLDAIRKFWTAVVDSEPRNVEISTDAVGSSGDLAHATGVLRITPESGPTSSFNYVLVLKKVEGRWKLHLDTWTPQGE